MSRTKKGLLNANTNLVFYFISAVMAFYSRKIFLEVLGDNFMGLFGTLGNMLGLLNLAELGIGTAIGIHLYKPIYNDDKKGITEIISVFGFLWRKVGIGILIVGIILSFFFPVFFSDSHLSFPLIYFLFYALLCSTLIGYFANYKQIMISSVQKNYIISIYFYTATLVKTLIQMLYVLKFRDYYGWIILEIIFSLGYSLILNRKIKAEFPWLNTSVKEGALHFDSYGSLWTKTKQVFTHKLSHLVLNQTDQILIYSFTSLATVAHYGNYALVINKVSSLFDQLFSGLNAGIGNLIEDKNHTKLLNVFWELNSFRYFTSGCLVVTLYFMMEPLVRIWVGQAYILDKGILILALLNVYLVQIVSTVELFKNAFGLFQDIWAPAAEVVMNLVIAIILGYYYGIKGVLAGTAVSALIIKTIWKPYYLYKQGFNDPVIQYWKGVVKYLTGLLITVAGVSLINIKLLAINTLQISGFLLYSILICCVSILLYASFMLLTDLGFRRFIIRIRSLCKK